MSFGHLGKITKKPAEVLATGSKPKSFSWRKWNLASHTRSESMFTAETTVGATAGETWPTFPPKVKALPLTTAFTMYVNILVTLTTPFANKEKKVTRSNELKV